MSKKFIEDENIWLSFVVLSAVLDDENPNDEDLLAKEIAIKNIQEVMFGGF